MGYSGFNIPRNGVVFTTTYVMKDREPILFVSHEIDQDDINWEFYSGNRAADMSKMMLVALFQVLDIDPTLSEVSNLPENHIARRRFIGDKWVYSKME